MTRRPPRHRPDQQGAALLTAMVIVALIATLTVGMIWQQWRSVQVEVAERTQYQARWLLMAATEWVRFVLNGDKPDVDDLTEPWAVGLKETRLSSFLAADRSNTDDAPDAFMSGEIRDAQARWNLRNLVRDNKYQPAEEATLRRLCEFAGVGPTVAQRLIDAMRQAHPGLPTEGVQPPEGGSGVVTTTVASLAAPLIPPQVTQLAWLGLDELTVARLHSVMVILPVATKLNLNTASKEVIAAVVPGADLAGAQRLVQYRLRAPLRDPKDALGPLGLKDFGKAHVDVKSSFFEVEGSLRIDQLVVAQRSLVERKGRGLDQIVIRRTDRIQPARQPSIALQQ